MVFSNCRSLHPNIPVNNFSLLTFGFEPGHLTPAANRQVNKVLKGVSMQQLDLSAAKKAHRQFLFMRRLTSLLSDAVAVAEEDRDFWEAFGPAARKRIAAAFRAAARETRTSLDLGPLSGRYFTNDAPESCKAAELRSLLEQIRRSGYRITCSYSQGCHQTQENPGWIVTIDWSRPSACQGGRSDIPDAASMLRLAVGSRGKRPRDAKSKRSLLSKAVIDGRYERAVGMLPSRLMEAARRGSDSIALLFLPPDLFDAALVPTDAAVQSWDRKLRELGAAEVRYTSSCVRKCRRVQVWLTFCLK